MGCRIAVVSADARLPSGERLRFRLAKRIGKIPRLLSRQSAGGGRYWAGAPTGIAFGYGTKFPAKYQHALYILDWTYGLIYAVHLQPQGSSYTGTFERFIAGQPLPVTDIVVGHDGALYFTIGGRRTQSGLYRVTYIGAESTRRQSQSGTLTRNKPGRFAINWKRFTDMPIRKQSTLPGNI